MNFLNKESLRFLFISLLIILSAAGCKKDLAINAEDSSPVAIFDETWNVMNNRYALFGVKQVNWKQKYDELRPQVNNNLTEIEVARLLNSMLLTLKDGHVALITPRDTTTYTGFFTSYPANFNYSNLINVYLKNAFKRNGPFIYKIEDNLAYIYCGSFAGDLTDSQLNTVFEEIRNTKGLILDVRNNTGGNGANANRLFSYFINKETPVKLEVFKSGPGPNDFFEPLPFSISPAGITYNKKVILLTNRACFSACNDFALYMSLLPNVTLVGDQTGGGSGNPNNYILANGWKLQYSATHTLSPDKMHIESGIIPDTPIAIMPDDENKGRDPIIEKALELLK